MHTISYWEKNTFLREADFIIIGSGIVGLSTALYLKTKKPKSHIVIIERGILPSGASTKNAGFACFGSLSEIASDLKKNSEEEVVGLVKKRWDGLQLLIKNLGKKNIGYENHGGHELFLKTQESLWDECRSQLHSINKLIKSTLNDSTTYTIKQSLIKKYNFNQTIGLVHCKKEAQIDTGKMMQALLDKVLRLGVVILNGINVLEFSETSSGVNLHTSHIELRTKNLLITTNGFAKQLIPHLPVVPARAQVLITQPIKKLPWKGTFHIDEGFYYFRNVGNRVLLGGGRNLDFKTEETYNFGLTPVIQTKLEQLLHDVILPSQPVEIDMRWSGIMGMGNEKKYILQKISPHVYCGVRMSGMGVALGSQVGKELASMALKS